MELNQKSFLIDDEDDEFFINQDDLMTEFYQDYGDYEIYRAYGDFETFYELINGKQFKHIKKMMNT